MNKINRSQFTAGVHLREAAEGDSRTIEGYAIVFGTPSKVLYVDGRGREVREVISAEAVSAELLGGSDIKMTMFHDHQLILARSNKGHGSLSYTIDEHGVLFTFEAPHTADGDKALELVRRGDISGCSFAFCIDGDDPKAVSVKRSEGGTTITINKIAKIFDFSLAANPAYPDTSVSLRELIDQADEAPAAEAAETDLAEAEAPEEQEREITNINPVNTMTQIHDTETTQKRTLTTVVREILPTIANGTRTIMLREDNETPLDPTINTTKANAGGIIPLRIKDVLGPINGGIIYDKVGIPISHNNSGQFLWPVYGSAEAKFVGETVAITPQTIELSKITAKPERLAIAFDVSRTALENSDGVMEDIVMRALTDAVRSAINKLLLAPTAPSGAPAGLAGPLVAASASNKVVTLSNTPTYKQLGTLKAKLYGSGIDELTPVAVMSPATRCALEVTSRDTGSGRMIIEDGKLLGMPVFETNAITDTYIAMADFRYQPLGFFGEVRLIIDPYSRALENCVRFVLNLGVATTTLRPEAFAMGKISAS